MTAVNVEGVKKSFGKTDVLRGVDLEVSDGTITAVLGPSGCGKTTLLRILAGFERPDAGTVKLDGVVVASESQAMPPEKRRIGYVAQEGALFPHLTVEANIRYGLSGFGLLGVSKHASRVSELLELVGMSDSFARRYPHQLSGGQQQRVALARALAPKPGLVFFDEPFSSLDAGLREGTRKAVAVALRESGATGVLVTHDQEEAFSMASKIAVMFEGRIAQAGSSADVYRAPENLEVAQFLGDANVLDGTSHGDTVSCALGTLASASKLSADRAVSVMIRPEQIQFTFEPVEGGVAATVMSVDFFGSYYKASLALEGGETVVAKALGSNAPLPGTSVAVCVRERVSAFER